MPNNLIDTILNNAGIQHRPVVYRKPPRSTYAVTFDDVSNEESADLINNLRTHDVRIELYEYSRDIAARKALERALDSENVKWERTEAVWLSTEQMYETDYTFTFYERIEAQ